MDAIFILGENPDVIIIDTLNAASAGQDENSAALAAAIKRHLTGFLAKGGTVIIVHHSGKNERSQMRGSSSLTAMADTTISVVANKDGTYTWRQEKSRDTVGGLTGSYKLKSVSFTTYDGDVDSHAVVLPLDDLSSESDSLDQDSGIGRKPKTTGTNIDVLQPFICQTLSENGNVMPEVDLLDLCIECLRQQPHAKQRTPKVLKQRCKDVLGTMERLDLIYRNDDMVTFGLKSPL